MPKRNVSVKFRNKEVQNPVARKVILVLLMVLVPIFLVIGAAMLIVLFPIMLVLHPFFVLFGRVGTIRSSRNGVELKLDKDSFRKVR